MRLLWKFTDREQVPLVGLAWDIRGDIPLDESEARTLDSVAIQVSAALAVVLDPESPPNCLGWRMLGPLVEAGLDLRDERVQEDILDFLGSYVWGLRDVANVA